jgi:hypothetical protein
MVPHRWLALGMSASFVVAPVACGQQGGAPGGEGDGDAAAAPDAPRPGDAAHWGDGADAGRTDGGAADGNAGDSAPADATGHDGMLGDAPGTDAPDDAKTPDGASTDAATGDAGTGDAGAGDAAANDTGTRDGGAGDGAAGVITGGPCLSGEAGATAYRVRWIDAGGTAQVEYEVDGLPDKSRDQTGAYGYQIGFTPSYVDPFLAQGGLQLDGSDFVDLEISTVGVSSIASATLSLYGRSYSVDTSGSFAWQTFDGSGQTATDFVSNVPPYQWYSADITGDILPGESGVLLRVTAGPSSGALVVNRIELCFVAR